MWRESNEELKENSEFRKIVDFSNPRDNKRHCEAQPKQSRK